MGLFDRFKKKKEEEKTKKDIKTPAKGKAVRKEKKKESRLFDPSKVPSSKEEKQKSTKEVKDTKKPAGKEKPKKVKKEDTGEAYRILSKPLLTEKATNLGAYGKYIFEVAPRANKIQIKKAIHDLYGVEVVRVNIMNQSGRAVQYGKSKGRTKSWKKAIITLKSGEKIEIYEGV